MLRAAVVSYSKLIGYVGIALWVVLAVAAGFTLFAAYNAHPISTEMINLTLMRLGWIAAAGGLAGCVLGMRFFHIAPIIFVAWFGTFGIWFRGLEEAIVPMVSSAITKIGGFPDGLTTTLPFAVTLLIAGLTSTLLLLLVTRKQKTLHAMGAISLLIALLALIPSYNRELMIAGAFVWVSGFVASSIAWGIGCAEQRLGLSCMNCSISLRGISGHTCPGCGWSSKRHRTPSLAKMKKATQKKAA